MAITIDFLANVSRLLRGTSDAEGALDDVAGSLDELAHAGGRNAEKLGDGIAHDVAGGAQDAGQAIDKLEGKFAELAQRSKREVSAVGEGIGTSMKHGTEKAGEGVETLKENTAQNLKEVAASFDGSAQSIGSGFQGLIAEVAEGFGPAGLIAGAVAAGGIGLIMSGLDNAQTATTDLAADAADLARAYIDAGSKSRRSLDDTAAAIEDLAAQSDPSKLSLSKLYDDARESGARYQDLVRDIATGDPAAIGKSKAAVDELGKSYEVTGLGVDRMAARTHANTFAQSDAAHRLSADLADAEKTARAAQEAQDAAAKAGLSDYARKAKLVEQLSGAYQDSAGAAEDYIDKESGLFNVNKYLTAMHKRADALREYQETLATSQLSPEAKNYIEGLGEDQAAMFMAGYKRSTPGQREQLNKIWTAAGRTSAHSYTEALGDDIADVYLPAPKIKPVTKAQAEAALAAARKYMRDHPLRANAVAYTPYGKPLF